ncbi:MAG: hypothetical protein V4447_10520 [Pseudomonadota bacterium]
MSKVTEWFDGKKFTPAHIGIYEVEIIYNQGKWYKFWNGKFFGFYMSTPEMAFYVKHKISQNQNSNWRGLTEDPNKSTQQRKS